MRVIRSYARRIAERFQPEKIILFGSYAYGRPHADSDVDLLVIMPARNELDQAFKIRCEVPAQFPMDLLVLKPKNLNWRLEERESFVTEIGSQNTRSGRPFGSAGAALLLASPPPTWTADPYEVCGWATLSLIAYNQAAGHVRCALCP
jgi:predicted nucleotidyltransferase